MPRQREMVATFKGEKFHFDNGEPGSENYSRVIIGDVVDEGGASLKIKGEAAEGELISGVPYRFYGGIQTHHKYGDQFHFSSFVTETPATEQAVVAYLTRLRGPKLGTPRGIGKAIAYHLWEEYGPTAVEVLRCNPDVVADATPRLSVEVARAAAEWLTRNQALEKTQIETYGLLSGRGFPRKTTSRAIAKWGTLAPRKIRSNPYCLMGFNGCGFKLTDKMWLDLGLPPGRLKRQALCAWHECHSDTDGHTWFQRSLSESGIRKNVGGASLRIDRAMELAFRAGLLNTYQSNGTEWVSVSQAAKDESVLAECVQDALSEKGCQWPIPITVGEKGLTPHQGYELSLATVGKIGCLAGGPGTGKTYCASKIIEKVIDQYGRDAVTVCAPTGKAAVRVTQALQESGVYIEARTIHSTLGIEQYSTGEWGFKFNQKNKLPFRFIVVDESSMIDTSLMSSLMAARARDAHILFVGDHRQLAPVGHGCPFLDFQRAGVPTGELTEVRRNSGRIVKACAEIREHRRLTVSQKLDVKEGENLIVVEKRSPEEQIESLNDLIQDVDRIPELSPVWDLQVVVAVNAKSRVSRTALNKHLQGVLNSNGVGADGNPFRVGDKIVNLKNGRFPSLDGQGDEKGQVFVANGEQAEAIEVEPTRTIARLTAGEKIIMIPHGRQQPQKGSQGDRYDDDETEAADDHPSANSSTAVGTWDLAYAISVHKSQGSEWPLVAVLIDEYPGAKFLCTRNWLYTAISRAKKACFLIGQRSTANAMCERDGLKRKTFLAELIKGRPAGVGVPETAVHGEPLIPEEGSIPSPAISLSDEEFDELFS